MQLSTFLLLDAVLLVLLQRAHSQELQAGERCEAIGQCAEGLVCVVTSSSSEIAHCQAKGNTT